jgi:hypothetical protein
MDHVLSDLIVFASLSDPEQNSGGEKYISDSDFLLMYGGHVLILDAKNIRTAPDIPLFLKGNDLKAAGGATLLELHSSVPIWRNILINHHAPYQSIHGCVVIVNNNKTQSIWKNQEWKMSDVKPIHITELVKFLHEWVDGKEPEVDLALTVAVARMQIRKDKGNSDIKAAMGRIFKI